MAKAKVSVDGSAKLTGKRKPRGKPFEKGNTLGFKAGKSGNPNGQPKGEKFETTLSRYLERDGAEVGKLIGIAQDTRKMVGVPFQDVLILRTLGAFCNDPNGAFFTVLRETKEGKLVEKSEIEQTVTVNDPRERLAHLIDSVAARRPKGGDSGQPDNG